MRIGNHLPQRAINDKRDTPQRWPKLKLVTDNNQPVNDRSTTLCYTELWNAAVPVLVDAIADAAATVTLVSTRKTARLIAYIGAQ